MSSSRTTKLSVLLAAALFVSETEAEEAVLGLVATRSGLEVADPRFVFAKTDLVIEAGDVLVLRVEASDARARAAGVELEFDDGSERTVAIALERSGWSAERVGLDAHAGRRLSSASVFVHEPLPGRLLVRLDDVAVERARGERIVLFDGSTKLEQRDQAARAGLVIVDGSRPASERARPMSGSVRDPWAMLELSTLRRRFARSESGAAKEFGLPRGRVFAGEGIPLAFADEGEPETVPARGQRISIEPLEGGAYYVLHLAVVTRTTTAFESTWRLVGADGEARDLLVAIPARSDDGVWLVEPDQGFADEGSVVLELPVASAFPIVALELPDDERLELGAATIRWKKTAVEDARFRRAFLERERPSTSLTHYLRAVRLDGVFTELGDEEGNERELFRRLVAGDLEGFDALLGERLVELKPRGRAWRGARVTFVPTVPAIAAALPDAEWKRATIERERQRADVLRRFARVRMDAPDGRTLDLLALSAPELSTEFAEQAEKGRIVPGPMGWMHGDLGLVGEAALARQLAFGAEAQSRAFGAAASSAWAPGDLAWFRQLPQLVAGTGVRQLVAAPIDWASSPRPSVCELEGPERTTIELVTPSALRSAGRFEALVPLDPLAAALEAAGARIGARELCVSLVSAAADEAILRENRRRAGALALAEIGPRARVATLAEYIAGAKEAPGFALPRWRANKEGARSPELFARSDELHAWTRKAENRLVALGVVAALAAPDGYPHSQPLARALWERVLANHAAAEAGADGHERVDDAREVVAAAEALTEEALRVLSLSVDTTGLGDPVFAFNSLALARSAPIVVADGDFDVWNPLGRVVPSQVTAEGRRVFEADIPSVGHAVYRLVPRAIATGPSIVDPPRARIEGWTMASANVQCVLDEQTGTVASLRRRVDGALGLETLRSGARLELVDASGVITELARESHEVLERGPVRVRTRAAYTAGDVWVVQELVLRAGSAYVEVSTHVEGRLEGSLRVVFDVVKPRDAAQRHVPFGYGTVRPRDGEHSRSGLLTWISQGDGFGVALASEDAAACGADGTRVWLWLADPEANGTKRTVRWAFASFEGSEQDAQLMAFGQEVAHPARASSVAAHSGLRPARHSYFSVARLSGEGRLERGASSRVVVAEFGLAAGGGGWVIRLFDASGRSDEVELDFDRPIFEVERVDVLGGVLSKPKFEPRSFRVRLDAWRVESFECSWKP